MQEGDPSKAWLYEKTCSVCNIAVGHGKFRPKKLKCTQCCRAVCSNCSNEQTVGTLCKKCAGQDVPSEEPKQRDKDSRTKTSELAAEDVLASAKEILADIKAKHSEIAAARTGDKKNEASTDILEKYQVQIAAYDTEIADMKKQIDWYAEQLDKREQTIQEMTTQVSALKTSNETLEQRMTTLQALLTRITPRPEERVPESRSCVKCQIF